MSHAQEEHLEQIEYRQTFLLDVIEDYHTQTDAMDREIKNQTIREKQQKKMELLRKRAKREGKTEEEIED